MKWIFVWMLLLPLLALAQEHQEHSPLPNTSEDHRPDEYQQYHSAQKPPTLNEEQKHDEQDQQPSAEQTYSEYQHDDDDDDHLHHHAPETEQEVKDSDKRHCAEEDSSSPPPLQPPPPQADEDAPQRDEEHRNALKEQQDGGFTEEVNQQETSEGTRTTATSSSSTVSPPPQSTMSDANNNNNNNNNNNSNENIINNNNENEPPPIRDPSKNESKSSRFNTAEKLQKLLQSFEDEEPQQPHDDDDTHPEASSASADTDTDDRTLLDVFGEVAKEFLTQKVIPPTDATCSWDWRSLQCEPACECTFQLQGGDFHLGRSCRRRAEQPPYCLPAPTPSFRMDCVTRLLTRTWNGTHQQTQRSVEGLTAQLATNLSTLHQNLCQEIRNHPKNSCLPAAQVSLPQRVLCGPVWVCPEGHEDDGSDDKSSSQPQQQMYHAAT